MVWFMTMVVMVAICASWVALAKEKGQTKYKLKCKINVKTYETAVIVMIVLARKRY